MKMLGTYARTIRHLKLSQIIHLSARRLFGWSHVGSPPTEGARRVIATPDLVERRPGFSGGPGGFTFLNISRGYAAGADRWKYADMPRLWRYNVHYFDWLLDPARPKSEIESMTNDWIASNPPGTPDAWDPYPISLRIVNWIKFATTSPDPDAFANSYVKSSLFHQAVWLSKNLEFGLLGNHLFKNIKALLIAGLYFDGPSGARLYRRGVALLDRELREQVLDDGGHFERSPMYHAIFTEDILDLLVFAEAFGRPYSSVTQDLLRTKAADCLSFLSDVTLRDGEIARFNDSANGVATPTQSLLQWGRRVTRGAAGLSAPDGCICRTSSGYYGWRNDCDAWLIDCGPVSVDYQPGHAHCDLLSYELVLGGRRIVTDTGTYDYEKGERRIWSRSTAAHNTVTVDGMEQSEVWACFRVGRRARPLDVKFEHLDRGARFSGAHDGFLRTLGIVHHRVAEFGSDRILRVRDELTGEGVHQMVSRIHLSPGLDVEMRDRDIAIVDESRKIVASVYVEGNTEIAIQDSEVYPQFGVALSSRVICLTSVGHVPMFQSYKIQPH